MSLAALPWPSFTTAGCLNRQPPTNEFGSLVGRRLGAGKHPKAGVNPGGRAIVLGAGNCHCLIEEAGKIGVCCGRNGQRGATEKRVHGHGPNGKASVHAERNSRGTSWR